MITTTLPQMSTSDVWMGRSSEYIRTSSWLIGKQYRTSLAYEASEYFRHMLSNSENPVTRRDKLVKLECDPMHFALLLSLLNKTRETDPYSWDELARIIKLGATYDFIHMPELVHPFAARCLDDSNAATISQFAGAYEYPDLAKYAIPKFTNSELGNFDASELPLSFYDKIAPRYAAALVIAMSQHP